MNQALHILQVAVVFLLMITVLVAAHEYGHYLFARLFRMGIHEFSIGFGRPKLWTWRRTRKALDDGTTLETEFNFRAWPLGGFVRIVGMEPLEDGSERKIANGFYSRPAWQRFLVLLAGPVFSVAAGFLVLVPIFLNQGRLVETTKIRDLIKTDSGYAAGLRPDDMIVALDGRAVGTGYEARRIVRDRTTGKVRIDVNRNGRPLTFEATPKIDEEPKPVLDDRLSEEGEPRRQARLGLSFATRSVPIGVGEAFGQAVDVVVGSAKGLGQAFIRPKENVGGMISVVGQTNEVVQQGLAPTLVLAALLSISIGFFNLLPIPPLDGGQLMITIVEMIRGGRRLSMRVQNTFFTVGLALMLTLFVGVFVLDIGRLREARKPQPKIVSSPTAK